MSPLPPALLLVVSLVVVARSIDLGLVVLNLGRTSRARGVPPILAGLLHRRPAELARRLALTSGRVALVRTSAETALILGLLLSGALPWLDALLSGAGLRGAPLLVAYLAAVLLPFALLDLPLVAWRTGRWRQLVEWSRTRALAAALLLPLLYAFHALVTATGPAWWLWTFAAASALQLLLLGPWPERLAVGAAARRPVSSGPLRERLEALVHASGLDAAGVFVVEASPHARANATLRGLLRPQVLLDDTLLARLPLEEVAAVAAHEIGHFRLRHRWQRLALRLAVTLGALGGISLALDRGALFRDFGFTGPSLHAALALAWLCGGALVCWLRPLEAALSRWQERAADAYAVRLQGRTSALASALLRLSEQNLLNPWPHPWYVAWRFSHPPLEQRLLALAHAASAP